jgi:hypothetical protein
MLPHMPQRLQPITLALDLFAVPAFLTDPYNRFVWVNQTFARLVGDPIRDRLPATLRFVPAAMLGPYRDRLPQAHQEIAQCLPGLYREVDAGRRAPGALGHASLRRCAPPRGCCRRLHEGAARPRSRGPRRCIQPRRCSRPCRRTVGRRAPGASTQAPSCANNLSPCVGTGPRVGRSCPPVVGGSGLAPRAGCSASGRFQANAARSNGIAVICQQTHDCNGWPNWPTAAGPWSSSAKTPRARVAWTTTRAGAGLGCIGLSRW